MTDQEKIEGTANDGFLVVDGQNRRYYIESSEGTHPRVAFDYRPMLQVEIESYQQRSNRYVLEQKAEDNTKILCQLLSNRIKWWNRPESCTPATLKTVNPVLLRRMEAAVLGVIPSDPVFSDYQEKAEDFDQAGTEKN